MTGDAIQKEGRRSGPGALGRGGDCRLVFGACEGAFWDAAV